MRNRPPFSCPTCGDTALAGSTCVRCRVPLVDQDGFVDVSPPVRAGGHFRFSLLGRWLSARRMTKRVREAWEKAGAVLPIAQAAGTCTVRGEVRVLSPVSDPFGRKVGAFRARKVVGAGGRELVVEGDRSLHLQVGAISIPVFHEQGGAGMQHVHYGSTVEESCRCGRFLVEDETGVALVDEDAVDVWVPPEVDGPDDLSFSIAAMEGATVEVMGPGAHRPAREEERAHRRAGYRQAATTFVFDGRPEARVWILVRPPG